TTGARGAARCRWWCRIRARTAGRRSARIDRSASRVRTRAAWVVENLSTAWRSVLSQRARRRASRPASLAGLPPQAGVRLRAGDAGDAARPLGGLDIAPELILEDAVNPLHLLLFAQLQPVAGQLRLARLAVLAGREVALLNRAFFRIAPLPFEEQLHRLAAAQTTHRTDITSHAVTFHTS